MGNVLHNHPPSSGSSYGGPGHKPAIPEETLHTEKSRSNASRSSSRSRKIRVTEDVGGRRDTIIIPSTGLEDFQKVVDEIARISAATPERSS